MSEELFPSGPWIGFYTYAPQDKHRMDLHLTFANGQMTGTGNDDIGAFVIKGRYDATSLECHWKKAYVGAHEVHYEGYREGKGIWGRWEINAFAHGGFHIWPQGQEQAMTEVKATEQPTPIPRREPVPSVAEVTCRLLFLRTLPKVSRDRLGAGAHVKLFVNVADVRINSLKADAELLGHLLGAVTAR